MSQPAPITADRTWDDLLRIIESFWRAAILTYHDISAFHERERPMSHDPDADGDAPQPRTTALDVEDTADRSDPAGQPGSEELHDDERRREEDEVRAREEDLDLEP